MNCYIQNVYMAFLSDVTSGGVGRFLSNKVFYVPNPNALRYAHTPNKIRCYTTRPIDPAITSKNYPSCVTHFIWLGT